MYHVSETTGRKNSLIKRLTYTLICLMKLTGDVQTGKSLESSRKIWEVDVTMQLKR